MLFLILYPYYIVALYPHEVFVNDADSDIYYKPISSTYDKTGVAELFVCDSWKLTFEAILYTALDQRFLFGNR